MSGKPTVATVPPNCADRLDEMGNGENFPSALSKARSLAAFPLNCELDENSQICFHIRNSYRIMKIKLVVVGTASKKTRNEMPGKAFTFKQSSYSTANCPKRPTQNENRKRSPDISLRISNCGERDPSVMGSATVPVAVFGVAPKTLQTDLSNDGSGATPEPAGGTPALPPNVQPKMNTGKEALTISNCELRRARPVRFGVAAFGSKPPSKFRPRLHARRAVPRPQPLPLVNIVGADNQRNNGFAVEVKQQAQITFNFNGVNRAPVIC